MPTNVSRYTCSFSDLAWESVDLDEDGKSASTGAETLPMFPKARYVKRYLEAYAERYIPPEYIGLSCTVTEVKKVRDGNVSQWSIKWQSSPGTCSTSSPTGTNGSSSQEELQDGTAVHQAKFNYLVIGSGFFGTPKTFDLPGIQKFSGTGSMVKHSSKLRNLDQDLLNGGSGKIVVVGGSFSGAEAAATMAFQLSSSKYSPDNRSPDYSGYTVHHITSRPFWVFPHYVLRPRPAGEEDQMPSAKALRPEFIPLEMAGNNLSNRAEDVIMHRRTDKVSPAAMRMGNERISKYLGTRQAGLGNGALSFDGQERMDTQIPWLAVSPSYAEFVRSGDITVHMGSMVGMESQSLKAVTGEGETQPSFQLDDATLLITATGFSPDKSLSFLESEVLESMNYKPNNDYEPLSLGEFSIASPAQPQLGFVGFYRGPYFGVMEMQARYLGKLWSGELELPIELPEKDKIDQISSSSSKDDDTVTQRGQFPMADYVGLMETLARKLGIDRVPIPGLPEPNGRGQGVVIASRYPSPNISSTDMQEVDTTLSSLARTLNIPPTPTGSTHHLSPAIFRALAGPWHLHRTLTSSPLHPAYPSGTFTGTATFHPRTPTAPGYAAEMLYIEDGELTTTTGFVMRGRRRYVYRLGEGEGGRISCWFVKPADNLSVDYLFHEIAFTSLEGNGPEHGEEEEGWKGIGSSHLCIEDMYESEYKFYFAGVDVRKWELGYVVKGPGKDYETKGVFTRDR